MGTTADKLNKLLETKAAIKQAIIDKGVDVEEGTVFADYPTKIAAIESGSGGGSNYENPDFYEIRTSGGTNYNCLFHNSTIESLDLSTWDTSNVTNMQYMFYGCSSLTDLDLSSFDTSNITNMQYMFYGCSSLTDLDLSSFDTSNITNMQYMFYGCKNLTTITGELDASKIIKGLFPSSYNNPFRNCTSLETLYLKNIYKVCAMTNGSKWSINLGDTKVKDECLIYIINELPDLINDKGLTDTSSIVLTLPTTNTLTAEQVQVAIDKGWTVANTTY